jgi:hypothetical protein
MRVADHIRTHLIEKCSRNPFSYGELARTEWSAEFERYMRNRLIMGALRYGLMYDTKRSGYDYVGSMVQRAESYLADGNQEHLVDAANCALLEFVRRCCHPSPHFHATDDNAELHVRKLP